VSTFNRIYRAESFHCFIDIPKLLIAMLADILRVSGTHWIGAWVGPRAGLEGMEK
jgi:hypothetical protein